MRTDRKRGNDMKRNLIGMIALALLAGAFSACTEVQVYPEEAFFEEPKIHTIAVAPFNIPESVATAMSQQFTSMSFKASDGAEIYYSTQFANEFAQGLTKFPGVRIITPENVERRWKKSMMDARSDAMKSADMANMRKEMNPMRSPKEARMIGATLGADAILVADVIAWDPFVPSMTLQWELLYTGRSTNNVDGTLNESRMGSAGGGEAGMADYSKEAFYREQIMLDADSAKTAELMQTWVQSIDEIKPYPNRVRAVRENAFPHFIRFASWAAMMNAYRAHGYDAK